MAPLGETSQHKISVRERRHSQSRDCFKSLPHNTLHYPQPVSDHFLSILMGSITRSVAGGNTGNLACGSA